MGRICPQDRSLRKLFASLFAHHVFRIPYWPIGVRLASLLLVISMSFRGANHRLSQIVRRGVRGIARDTAGNAVFRRAFDNIYAAIREGESMAIPLKEARIVDDLVVNMVDVGEETGALDTMLYKIADVYDEEVSVLVEGLINLLEPMMVVILGLIVGFIVIALFMPLIKLLEGLSK